MNGSKYIIAVLIAVFLCASSTRCAAQSKPKKTAATRTRDVIYLKKDGFALTYDILTPQMQNGAGIVFMVSGGWYSSHDSLKSVEQGFFGGMTRVFLDKGFTLYYVIHGSQPRFTAAEAIEQTTAAIHHIRQSAARRGIHATRIGVAGGSAGGHLSLMQGLQGRDHVQAVVAYFPPTDFLNYGAPDVHFDTVVRGLNPEGNNPFWGAVELRELNRSTTTFVPVTDKSRHRAHLESISPIHHVDPGDAPTLLLHGDADKLVPLQQSRILIKKLRSANVPNRLIIKQGAAHGWASTDEELKIVTDWFLIHLSATPESDPSK
ncbi:MAG: alpha/beta hydrolase [Planctomycetota bacterium]|nr:alpha/beta hydrolase [Planctomycetota bacterium]